MVLGQKEGTVGHVQDGVVDQYHFTEVKLVGESFAFGLVQNPFVVVIPAMERVKKSGYPRRDKGNKEEEEEAKREGLTQCLCQGSVSSRTDRKR